MRLNDGDYNDDEDEAVDDEGLDLEGPPLPAENSLKSFHRELC